MKQCFKCLEVKELFMFYKHPQMADGHVNKCKECNKKDVRKNRSDKVDYYREYDAIRYRKDDTIKERNRISALTYDVEKKKISTTRYIENNLKARKAHIQVGNAVKYGRIIKPTSCSKCCNDVVSRLLHAHHDDYDKPLDVRWLCTKCHGYEHSKYKHLYKEEQR